ncbi:MAG: hypothetical protein WC003_16050 [Terrimicrobiaceae bacterium]
MRFRPVLRDLLSGFLPALLMCAGAQAKEPEIITPPLVKPATVSIPSGEPSSVYLRASGRIEEPMTFLIRKPPKHGDLGAIERVDRNTAVVIYTPRDKQARDDEFTYAAKSADSPVSASAAVSLRIVEMPAVLEFAKELDFGTVFLGEQSKRTLEISNSGGATATGSISANPPWRVEGSGDFAVPGGSQCKVPLIFEPSDERDFRERILLGKGFAASVQVLGSGIAPVSWPRKGLEIRPDARESGAAMIFRNNTSKPLEISFNWPEIVSAPQSVSLPADGSESIRVRVKAGEAGGYAGEVPASIKRYSFVFPLKIYPAVPRIILSPPGSLLLKETKPHVAEGSCTIESSGGSNLVLSMTVPPGMTVAPSPSDVVLDDGRKQTFVVTLDLRKAASPGGDLFVEASGCAPVRVPYQVEKARAEVPGGAGPVEKFLRIPAAAPPPATISSHLPPTDKIWLLSSGPHEVSVIWKKASPEIRSFRVERRITKADRLGQLAIKWVTWPEVKVDEKDGSVTARFAHLPENSRWVIHVVPLDKDGNPGPPSPAFPIATKPVRQGGIPRGFAVVVLAALGVAGVYFWRRSRAGFDARENERITRLEGK